ncbi:hypothetical protein ATO2_01135 [Roseovarius sp. 22II1-1F6A]|nr:hypothetical protein ATO2_01135 [Roseovarius sp. 22II1-1F6A]
MQTPRKTLALTVLMLGLAQPLAAQDTTPAAPAAEGMPAAEPQADAPAEGQTSGTVDGADTNGLDMGSPAETGNGVGDTYIKEVSGDWEIRCVRTEAGNDPCQLYQLLKDGNGNSVAEMSIFDLPSGQQAVAGATIITPLETLLTQQIRLSVDGSQGKRYPFTLCTRIGCFARVGFTEEDVNAFRRGAAAQITIVPAGAPDQTVDLAVSLSGFTAGYSAMAASNAEARQAAQ